jgi:hypothetical protein
VARIQIERQSPASLHQTASQGHGVVFATLAEAHYCNGLNGTEPPMIALARAVDCARLAAMNRRSREDWVTLLYLLDQHAIELAAAGLTSLADKVLAEAVALAESMAEDGDEEVGCMIVASADQISPAAMIRARSMVGNAAAPNIPIVPIVLVGGHG